MIYLIFGLYIFFDIIGILVFIDVILSWLLIFQINFRPKFIANILDPIYKFVKSKIPTTIGIMDFTPIIVIIGIYFLKGLIIAFFPEVSNLIRLYSNI
ncbi:MAG: YggT family protein [Candidatus Gracilibacteria bacterium]|nr:YggT family protein [Candidatus Gracilibacteria bacterium]